MSLHPNCFLIIYFNALIISTKSAATNDAPPTSPPSTSGQANNSFALFKTGDVEALTQKIKKIAEDKSFALQQSEINLREVRKFDIELMTDNYLGLYKRLLQS